MPPSSRRSFFVIVARVDERHLVLRVRFADGYLLHQAQAPALFNDLGEGQILFAPRRK
jgi:hypothetical protein